MGSLPVMYRAMPSLAATWSSTVSVHSTAAGSSSRAARYASLPMKSADLTFGPGQAGLDRVYSPSSSAPISR